MEKTEQYAQFWKRVRVDRQLTQQQLADILGIRFQFISAVERGDSHFSLEQTRRLVRKFKLDVNTVVTTVMRAQEIEVRAAFGGGKDKKKKKILRA